MGKVFIYALTEPDNINEIRYIGKTKNLTQRFKFHLKEAINNRSYKNNWVRGIINKGLEPLLIIVDEVSEDEWDFWETFYVDLYKSWGFKLTNTALPGKGGTYSWQFTKEVKKNLRFIYYTQHKEDINIPFELWNTYREEVVAAKKQRSLDRQKHDCILCIDYKTGNILNEFANMSVAAKTLDIPSKRIEEIVNKRVCCGKIRKSYHGLVFVRKEDYNSGQDYKPDYKINRDYCRIHKNITNFT